MALTGKRIVVTGPTGQVGRPVAEALAADNQVFGVARFSDPKVRDAIEKAGVECVPVDLAEGDLSAVPDDVDYVLNFAVTRTGDFDHDLAANAEATGLLMSRCRNATTFLHCSSTAVYEANGHHAFAETDPLGDNHRVMFPTYSIAKIAAEAVARTAARQLNLKTTIARLNVPYGDHGGWPWFHLLMMKGGHPIPVNTDKPSVYNPIHDDDILAMLPLMLEIASVPATIVNWAGPDQVSIEDWCAYLGELTGLEPQFDYSDQALPSVAIDTTRLHELVGPAKVNWKDGFRRMVEAESSGG